MSWYCAVAVGNPIHGSYHDHEYGFPTRDERVLFERFCLEIFQAGLSWEIILKRRAGIFEAFEGFDPDKIATWGDEESARLLADPRIIRNRLKVKAVLENARRWVALRQQYSSFDGWLTHHHPLTRAQWTKLFRQAFTFTGGEIVNELLMSIGYLPGTHAPECATFATIASLDPPWMLDERNGFVF